MSLHILALSLPYLKHLFKAPLSLLSDVKCFKRSVDWKISLEMQVHLPCDPLNLLGNVSTDSSLIQEHIFRFYKSC